MASALSVQKFRSTHKMLMYDHDPGATTALITTPDGGTTDQIFDMRDYESFVVAAAMSVVGTSGAITKLEIVANDVSDFSGTTVVVKDSGTVDADATGDWLIQECTAEEVAQLGAENSVNLRYVAGRLTLDASDAEAVVVYIGHMARHEKLDLTPATTIA